MGKVEAWTWCDKNQGTSRHHMSGDIIQIGAFNGSAPRSGANPDHAIKRSKIISPGLGPHFL